MTEQEYFEIWGDKAEKRGDADWGGMRLFSYLHNCPGMGGRYNGYA